MGELGDAELTKVGESNALLLLLELLIMTAHLSSAKVRVRVAVRVRVRVRVGVRVRVRVSVRVELLIMTAHLSSAKLPRYLSALELHASLASKLESAGQVRGLTSPKPHRNPP